MEDNIFIKAECQFKSFVKTSEGTKITLLLQPTELTIALHNCNIGQRLLVAIAEIRDDETYAPPGGF